MSVLLIRQKATGEEIKEMLKSLENYVKVAVDISNGILAGGGVLHADCESVLLEEGSKQEDIWGADWYPEIKEIRYEAMINISLRRNNRSREIQNPTVRETVGTVIKDLLDVE